MRRVLRIGHRGSTEHAPENTLAEIQTRISSESIPRRRVRSTAAGGCSTGQRIFYLSKRATELVSCL